MISDVLNDAVSEIDYYLNEETFKEVYQGEIRDKILKLRNEMERNSY